MKTIPYGRQWISKEDIRGVVDVLKSDWITQGPKIREFEEAMCSYTGARFAVAVSNGTAALHIACLAAGIEKGDEAITSPFSFAASANCIVYCGARPVFADIEPQNFNLDPSEIKARITRRTKAIIAVHYAGHPCELDKIRQTASRKRIAVIEDAAHALGAAFKGSRTGSCVYSDMTTLSFHPVKSITTGEGGMVLTNNRRLYERLLLFRNHGIIRDPAKMVRNDGPWYYEMHELGFNYRITDFQCALGMSQLKKLDRYIELRRRLVDIYSRGLSDIEDITLPVEKSHTRSSWHLFVIRLKGPSARKNRKALFMSLRANGINSNVHYIPIFQHPFYVKYYGYKKGDLPVTESIYDSVLSLPLYPKMARRDITKVISAVRDFFNNNKDRAHA